MPDPKSNLWFAGNFCPRGATCSEGEGALTPSSGPKIRTLDYETPPQEYFTATVKEFPDEESFVKAFQDPRDWAKCEGQILSIPEFAALFSLIGTFYGGDGRTTFGLPDMRNQGDGKNDYYINTKAPLMR